MRAFTAIATALGMLAVTLGAVLHFAATGDQAPAAAPVVAQAPAPAPPSVQIVTSGGAAAIQAPAPARSAPEPQATPEAPDWFASVTGSAALAARRLTGAPPPTPTPKPSPTPRRPEPQSDQRPTPIVAPPPLDVQAARAAAEAARGAAAQPTAEPPAPKTVSSAPPPQRPPSADADAGDPAAVVNPTTRSAAAEARIRAADAARAAGRTAAPRPAQPSPAAAAAGDARQGAANQAAKKAPARPARPVPTPVPAPSPIAAPPPVRSATGVYVPPPIRNGDNKWGVGVYRTSNNILDVIRQTQPGVVLLMDPDEAWAKKVREAAPSAFIVGRHFAAEQPLDDPDRRGAELADKVAERAVPLKGVVDAWMGYNEVIGSEPNADYGAYNRFQVAFAKRLQDTYGIAAVAGNDGPAALEPEDYPKYFADAIRASQFFGLHAYSPPGTSSMQVDAEWNTLRYRKIHDALEAAGIHGKQMVITESGLGDGYRPGVTTDDQMAQGFAWFTRELQKDPYMIGQAAFGLFDATGAWSNFELTNSTVPKTVRQLLGGR